MAPKKRLRKSKFRFSFFFMFESCRKSKKNRQTLANTSDDESYKDTEFYKPIVKESKTVLPNSTKKSSVKDCKQDNCDGGGYKRTEALQSQKFWSPTKQSGLPKLEQRSCNNNTNNKMVKNFNLKFSPLKKRHNNFSPSKESPLNCHVTVELAQSSPSSNLLEEADGGDEQEDKEPLLQKNKSLSPRKSNSNAVLKEKTFGTVTVGRSKSFTEKDNFLQRKQQLSRKLQPLLTSRAAKKNTQNFSKSTSSLVDKERSECAPDDKSSYETKRLIRQRVRKFKSEKSKSLLDIAPKHLQTTTKSDSVQNDAAETYDVSWNKEYCGDTFIPNFQTSGRDNSNKVMKSFLTAKTIGQRPQSSRSKNPQRPFSLLAGSDESNYVMLNPIPPVFKDTVKRQVLFDKEFSTPLRRNHQYQTKTTSMLSAKSQENLGSGISDKRHNYSNWTAGHQNSFNDSQLYSSPAIDYAAKVEDLLVKLRKSLKREPDQNSYATWNPSSSGYPMKKSKSLEPITAYSQFSQPDENSYADRYPQCSRSRSRARHIAKKYSMYTSNENLPVLSHNSMWDQKLSDTSAGLGHDDYVYLSQIPNYSNEPTFSTDSYSPSKEPYLMSSRSGDFYHLNLYVDNSRSTPDGAESTPHSHRPEISKELYSGYSAKKSLCNPQVYYSLDV